MSSYLLATDCTGRCRQGRDCTCTGLCQKNGGQEIDTEQMRANGVIEGPFRKSHPVTLGWFDRLKRWIDYNIVGCP